MARRRRRRGGHNSGAFWVCIVLLSILLVWLYHHGDELPPTEQWQPAVEQAAEHLPETVRHIWEQIQNGAQQVIDEAKTFFNLSQTTALPAVKPETAPDGQLRVYSFQMGNADAHLIQTADRAMLIDAGEAGQSEGLVRRLKQLGVTKLDCVVATHPHTDHIGGMAEIIRVFKPAVCYLPQATHTTDEYAQMLAALEDCQVDTISPQAGDTAVLGDAHITFLGPMRADYLELNDHSIVLRLTYGSKAFLFMGDAQSAAEQNILDSGAQLTADVLKVGHHGSDTSSSEAFLDAVAPKYAIVCADSIAGLSDAVDARLQALGTTILCTQSGDILFTVQEDALSVQIITPQASALSVFRWTGAARVWDRFVKIF